MAHTFKKDVEVTRTLTSNLVKANGFDTVTLSTDAVTGIASVIDLASGNRDFTILAKNTSVGDIDIAAPTNPPADGNRIRINIANLDIISRDVVFDTAYKRSDGTDVGTLIITAGEGRSIEVLYTDAAPTTWVVSYDTGHKLSSGLSKQGSVTSDADAGEGLYSLDASAGDFDFTLPAAAGTQSRYIFLGESFGVNSTTIRVQPSEDMNAILNGTFTANTEGQMLLAVDTKVGNWDLTVLGAAQAIASDITVFDATQVTLDSGTTTLVYNVGNPATGTVTINDGEITRIGGDKALWTFDLIFDEDDIFVLDFAALVPAGGFIVSALCTATDSTHEPFADINFSLLSANSTKLKINRSDTINADVTMHISFIVSGYPEFNQILAGMVTPTKLANGISQLAIDHDITASGGISVFQDTLLTVTVPSAGRWKLSGALKAYIADGTDDGGGVTAVLTNAFDTIVNDSGPTSIVAGHDTNVLNSSVNKGGSGLLEAYVTTTGAAVYKVRVSQYTDSIGNFLLAGSSLRFEQLPDSTVVNPDSIVPTAMSNLEIGLATTAAGTVCPFDTVLLSDGNGLSLAGNGVTVATSGKFRIEAYGELLTVTQDVEIRVNGISVQTYTEGSIQNRPKPVIMDLASGDVVTLFTATSASWLGGATSPTTDTNFARLLVTQMQDWNVIRPEDVAVSYNTLTDVLAIGDYRQETGFLSAGGPVETVNFTTTFASPPRVIHSTGSAGAITSISRTSYITNITTTSFDLAVVSGSGVFQPANVTWQATGTV